ncbi:MAG: hypothetical protein ACREPX_08345 [Rhodanobacteraceae bacterium]
MDTVNVRSAGNRQPIAGSRKAAPFRILAPLSGYRLPVTGYRFSFLT